MNDKNTEIAAKFRIKTMITQDGQNGNQPLSTYDVELWIHCDYKDEIMRLLHFDSDDTMMAVVPRLIASSRYMDDARRNVGNQIWWVSRSLPLMKVIPVKPVFLIMRSHVNKMVIIIEN